MLDTNGHLATAAESGAAMRAVLAGNGPKVDAIVLDCVMPGEPSALLALYAKALEIPLVMISGALEIMQFADDNSLQLLHKPFRLPELLAALDQAMTSREFGQRRASLPG